MKEWEARARSLNCINQGFRINETLLDLEKRFKQKTAEFELDDWVESDSCFCKD